MCGQRLIFEEYQPLAARTRVCASPCAGCLAGGDNRPPGRFSVDNRVLVPELSTTLSCFCGATAFCAQNRRNRPAGKRFQLLNQEHSSGKPVGGRGLPGRACGGWPRIGSKRGQKKGGIFFWRRFVRGPGWTVSGFEVVLLYLSISIVVVVGFAAFCGQVVFCPPEQPLAPFSSMWADTLQGRGAGRTTWRGLVFLWITCRLCGFCPQGCPQTRQGAAAHCGHKKAPAQNAPGRDKNPGRGPEAPYWAGVAAGAAAGARAGAWSRCILRWCWPWCLPSRRPWRSPMLPMPRWWRQVCASKVFCCAGVSWA